MSIADLKHQELPLARIKKIMKLDEDVKVSGYNLCWCFLIKTCQMISAEAPVLFAKAAEMFIHELTMRAWIHTEVGFFFSTRPLLLLKMVGQQEKDSSEEWHCHGNHKIRPVWLPHRHCAQVLYINIDIARSDTYSGFYESANSNILPSRDDIKPTTKREESSVRMVPDQVSWKNFEITFWYIKGF